MRPGDPRVLAVALLAACGEPAAGEGDAAVDAAVETIACELGRVTPAGAFVPVADDDRAEVVLGFQGFMFFEMNVRTSLPAPPQADVLVSVTLEGAAPYGTRQLDTELLAGDGHAVSEAVVVFLDSAEVAEYAGHAADIAVRLDGPGVTCTATGRFRLVDEDRCIHTGDTPICPDAGVP